MYTATISKKLLAKYSYLSMSSSLSQYYAAQAAKYTQKRMNLLRQRGGDADGAPIGEIGCNEIARLALGKPANICQILVRGGDGEIVAGVAFDHGHSTAARQQVGGSGTVSQLTGDDSAQVFCQVYAALKFMRESFRMQTGLGESISKKHPVCGNHAAGKVDFRVSRDIAWSSGEPFRISLSKVNEIRDGYCYQGLAMYATSVGKATERKHMGRLAFYDCKGGDITASLGAYIMMHDVCLRDHSHATYMTRTMPFTSDKPAPATVHEEVMHHTPPAAHMQQVISAEQIEVPVAMPHPIISLETDATIQLPTMDQQPSQAQFHISDPLPVPIQDTEALDLQDLQQRPDLRIAQVMETPPPQFQPSMLSQAAIQATTLDLGTDTSDDIELPNLGVKVAVNDPLVMPGQLDGKPVAVVRAPIEDSTASEPLVVANIAGQAGGSRGYRRGFGAFQHRY
jgi:hypothetical protein